MKMYELGDGSEAMDDELRKFKALEQKCAGCGTKNYLFIRAIVNMPYCYECPQCAKRTSEIARLVSEEAGKYFGDLI